MWIVKHKRDVVSPRFKRKRDAIVWMKGCGVSGCYVAGGREYGL